MQKDGSVLLAGRVTDSAGTGPPAVHLLTYQLSGTITDASGKPVQGAVVITRTQDRDFWTHSSATDANGHYNVTLPIASAFFRNAIVTVVVQSLPAGPSARASIIVSAPNFPAPPDDIPPSVR